MEIAQVFMVYAEWIFFTAWGTVLAALAAVAFGRDVISRSDRKSHSNHASLPSASL